MDQLFSVEGRLAVVTGVAGQIASKLAEALLSRGCRVVGIDLVSPSRQLLRETNFSFFAADVSSASDISRVQESISLNCGAVEILINAAGIDSAPNSDQPASGPFENLDLAEFEKVVTVNLLGVVNCCRIIGGKMAENHRGSIINIGSIYGSVAPDQSLYQHMRDNGVDFYKPASYGASKAGVINLSKYLGAYWAKSGVRVNSLSPSGVLANQDPGFRERYENRIPIGRLADVAEFVGPVVFLCSDASSYMTGHNLIVDGGWLAI